MFTVHELKTIATVTRLALAAHSMQLADDMLADAAKLCSKCGAHIAKLEAAEQAAAEKALESLKKDIDKDVPAQSE